MVFIPECGASAFQSPCSYFNVSVIIHSNIIKEKQWGEIKQCFSVQHFTLTLFCVQTNKLHILGNLDYVNVIRDNRQKADIKIILGKLKF